MAGGMLLVSAQQVPDQAAPPATGMHQRAHKRAARMAQYLNLTPAQVAQAKTGFQAARQSAQPVRQQLKQVRASMLQAVRANDMAKIDQLSAQEGSLKGQLLAIRHEAFAKFYAGLSPEQQAKADQLPAHMRQMRQQRMANHQNG
jgi:Spy/CpxP family protein refolding chaperone